MEFLLIVVCLWIIATIVGGAGLIYFGVLRIQGADPIVGWTCAIIGVIMILKQFVNIGRLVSG